MGLDSEDYSQRGILLLTTNDRAPFGRQYPVNQDTMNRRMCCRATVHNEMIRSIPGELADFGVDVIKGVGKVTVKVLGTTGKVTVEVLEMVVKGVGGVVGGLVNSLFG